MISPHMMDAHQKDQMSHPIQPLYLAQAQVYLFEKNETKSWIPLQPTLTPISVVYDAGRLLYRIMSVDTDCKQIIVNCTIVPGLSFHKTSTTFGHWTDEPSGMIYGVGFTSQNDIDAFHESLKKAQAALLSFPMTRPSTTTAATSTISSRALNPQFPTFQHPSINPILKESQHFGPTIWTLPSWGSHPDVIKFLEIAHKTDVDVTPTLSGYNVVGSRSSPTQFNFIPPEPFSNSYSEKVSQFGQNGFPKAYNYGMKPQYVDNSACGDSNKKSSFKNNGMEESGWMAAEFHRVKDENVRLKQILIESSTNLKKWEIQMEAIQSDNSVLSQKVGETKNEIEGLKDQKAECHKVANKWKDYIANNAAKLQAMKETEQKIQIVTAEKQQLQSRIKELQETRLTTAIRLSDSKLARKPIHAQNLADLEAKYRDLVAKTQKPLNEALAVNVQGLDSIQRVDNLFAKVIHELISVHGQIYKPTEFQQYGNNYIQN